MPHITTPEAEALLDVPVKVLDKGIVQLVDYMGGDERVVAAARVSYGGGTKSVREDAGLINYLMRNRHTSPFEQTVLTFYLYLPIFIMRQLVRHRTARLNEYSGRYSEMPDDAYMPSPDELGAQGKINKQGSGAKLPPDVADKIIQRMKGEQGLIRAGYQSYLADDCSREMARINLPLAQYTACFWQIDAHNLIHFLRLRLDGHAQPQIRAFAEPMAAALKAVAPLTYAAAEEFVFGQCRMQGRTEREAIARMMREHVPQDALYAEARKLGGKSERVEFLDQFGQPPLPEDRA